MPHGLLQIVTYESKALRATRQAYVYTPPDYTTRNALPVLYLLHGGGDLDPGWSMTGRAHIIMDNLIAERKARAMIVVMPVARGGGSLGSGRRACRPASGRPATSRRPAVARGTGRRRSGSRPRGPGTLQAFAQDFLGDLMPTIEKTFRVRPSGASRHRRPFGRRRGDGQHGIQPAGSLPLCRDHERGRGRHGRAVLSEVLRQERRGSQDS